MVYYYPFQWKGQPVGYSSGQVDANGNGGLEFQIAGTDHIEYDQYKNGKIVYTNLSSDVFNIDYYYKDDETVKRYFYSSANTSETTTIIYDEGPYVKKEYVNDYGYDIFNWRFYLSGNREAYHLSAYLEDYFHNEYSIDTKITNLASGEVYSFNFQGGQHDVSGKFGGSYVERHADGSTLWELGLGDEKVRVLEYRFCCITGC